MAAVLLAVLGGCATDPRPADTQPLPQSQTYLVKRGDTLFAIATRFGIDHRDLARWNRLGDANLIYPGQTLRLAPPGTPTIRREEDAAPAITSWRWPTAGAVVARFGQSQRAVTGILIEGRPDQPIEAAADGEVVYAGSGLTGYGQLVIVKHNSAWLSAYGHNSELLVREGERVRTGQRIASMGSGAGHVAVLHFEIRRNGVAIDPLTLLPAR